MDAEDDALTRWLRALDSVLDNYEEYSAQRARMRDRKRKTRMVVDGAGVKRMPTRPRRNKAPAKIDA